MSKPGQLNLITDVPGIRVGHAEAPEMVTGVTAIIPDEAAVAACSVTGGAPGTRGTTVLGSAAVMTHAHGIVLSGGSAYGLDAPGGAMDWLRGQDRGFRMGAVRVPIVPGAIIFDLMTGGVRDWDDPPWWRLGREAAATADPGLFALGNAGAGLGARAGSLKGGVGSASLVSGPLVVGALAVVNALGETVIPGSSAFWAWPFERDGEFGNAPPPATPVADLDHDFSQFAAGENTTLGVIATNAALDRAGAERVAVMAQDGLARAIRPAHSPLDGDTVFVLATGAQDLGAPISATAEIGHMAADCLARAVARGVYEAVTLAGHVGYRERHRP